MHDHHLTAEDRDAAFWYSFHPDDRKALLPQVLTKHPFQPLDIPFPFEDVFDCACGAFAYKEHLSFRPCEQEFEPWRTSRRYPSPSYTSDPQLPSLFSPSPSESRYTTTPSATKDEPRPKSKTKPSTPIVTEPEHEATHSITPTSRSMSLLASLCTNVVPESEPQNASSMSEPPPMSSIQPDTVSLVPSCHINIPKPECMPPNLPMSPISSCTNTVPEPELIPSLLSTLLPLPSKSSISSTDLEHVPSPVRSATEVLPRPECEHSTSLSLISLAPSPSPIDSPPAPLLSCEFPPILLSHSLVLGDLELKSSLFPVDIALEQTLGVTPNEVTSVTSMPPSAIARLVLPTSHSLSDHSHAFSHPFLTIEVSSLNHDLPSSPGKLVPIVPAPSLKASNIPSAHSSPSQPPHEFMQEDSLSDSLEGSLTIPTPVHSTPPHRPPGLAHEGSFLLPVDITPVNLFSSLFEITSAPILPALLSSNEQVSSFVTTAVLLSTVVFILSTISTYAHRFWSNKGVSSTRISIPSLGSNVTHRPQFVQSAARPAQLVFDPGGLVWYYHHPRMLMKAS